jgi:DNA-binding CsgD family transcriptional regulator
MTAFSDAIERAQATGGRVRLIRALEGYARCLATQEPELAVRVAGATDSQRQLVGAVPWPSERRYIDAWLNGAKHTLGQTAYFRAWEDGHASSLDQAVSMAGALAVDRQVNLPQRGPLSAREADIARLLAQGLTNKEIAVELLVSPGTVRSHVEHILAKLDLRSRAQIAVWATQEGVLPAAKGATRLLP